MSMPEEAAVVLSELEDREDPFALLFRPMTSTDVVEVVTLDGREVDTLAETAPDAGSRGVLALVPFRQVAERGLPAVDDGCGLLRFEVTSRHALPTRHVLDALPVWDGRPERVRFEPDDERYGATVATVLDTEIAEGTGANFVLRRDLVCDVGPFGHRAALRLFRTLLGNETGAHWTFLIWTGSEYHVGASPEMHVSLAAGVATMNPISGTFRYGSGQDRMGRLLAFLEDPKETEELYQVLDEELKMMSQICNGPSRVVGPSLRPMRALAHTEYFIQGVTDRPGWEILRGSLLAPTIIGSPLRSACETIARYEPQGRNYYGGVVALLEPGRGLGTDRPGDVVDSAILIRTARVRPDGELRCGVGATVVRESTPEGEIAETRVKAEAMQRALQGDPATAPALPVEPDAGLPPDLGSRPELGHALDLRNDRLSPFWLGTAGPLVTWPGLRVLIVDAEDDFTSMLARQLETMGMSVQLTTAAAPPVLDGADLVVLGPGPGDPRDDDDARIRALRRWVDRLLEADAAFLAICLSHQVLAHQLGFELTRLPRPQQGTQRQVEFLGEPARVAFYNSFAARPAPPVRAKVKVKVEPIVDVDGQHLVGLVGDGFVGMQFHPESVLTVEGPEILNRCVEHALSTATLPPSRGVTSRMSAQTPRRTP